MGHLYGTLPNCYCNGSTYVVAVHKLKLNYNLILQLIIHLGRKIILFIYLLGASGGQHDGHTNIKDTYIHIQTDIITYKIINYYTILINILTMHTILNYYFIYLFGDIGGLALWTRLYIIQNYNYFI